MLSKQTSKTGSPETHATFMDTPAKENTCAETSSHRKVLPVLRPQAKVQEEAKDTGGGKERNVGKSVKSLETTSKTTAEMKAEMMQLFEEAKRSGCIVEVERNVGKSVKSLEMTSKTTAEMKAEMMQLFEEAKRSGCIVEVRSRSKHADSFEKPADVKNERSAIAINKNVLRSKTKEEMHSEMMKLFEEAKALGFVIEVTERPHEDNLFPNQVGAPLRPQQLPKK
jgi:endo-alpha-1,4-polygalactosaminidase (GH114 family)